MGKFVQPRGVIQWPADFGYSSYVHFAMDELFTESSRARRSGVARSLSALRRESLKGIVDAGKFHQRPDHIIELNNPRLNAIWLSYEDRLDLFKRYGKAWDESESLNRRERSELQSQLLALADAIEDHPAEMAVMRTKFDQDLEDDDIVFVGGKLAPDITPRLFLDGVNLLYEEDPDCLEWPVADLIAAISGWWGIRAEVMEQYVRRASFLEGLERLDSSGDYMVENIEEYVGDNVIDDSAEVEAAKQAEREAFEAKAREERLVRESKRQARKAARKGKETERLRAEAVTTSGRKEEDERQEASTARPVGSVILRRTPERALPAIGTRDPDERIVVKPQPARPTVSTSRSPAVLRRRAAPILSTVWNESQEAAPPVDVAPPKAERYTWDQKRITFDTVIKATTATLSAKPALWNERVGGVLPYRGRISAINRATDIPIGELESFVSHPRRIFQLGQINPWVADFIGYDEDSQGIALMGHLSSWQVFSDWAGRLANENPQIEGYYNQMAYIGSRGEGGFDVHLFPATYASMCYRIWLRQHHFGAHTFPHIGLPPIPQE